ncbi:N-acetylmannosamine-6-phosphate 2-epimerase [Suttonella ornithocola]|uniref:Putative N-acetylmannosamine-6-phosphate 2-epimerase n=1 Tax=Suttonella ornithocola TaxID=279832 RepID=A0A380MYE8_9GAMM|nr:N-acetylmannosamine-6-phosphate 2-epimerase [Suttonella ornithocola]SUO97585.1 Putative N-acetylmannosamine-6-phosphate 2-epimerase [Suttonella ornithocola]
MATDHLQEQLKGKLIVSCQALPDEPLHSSFIMGRMALAATQGGAGGIRANTPEDIAEIRKNTQLPIIGIVKRDYPDSEVFITATMREIDELMQGEVVPDIIAIDARDALRPNGQTLSEFYAEIRAKYPHQALMADCASLAEMMAADTLGFDYIGTTLVGYTSATKGEKIETDDFALIRLAKQSLKHPIIAEGNINTPEKVRRVLDIGVHSVVVGSAITRPKWITEQFVAATQR